MVGVVERLLESSHYQEEVRLLGGIPLLLGLLRYGLQKPHPLINYSILLFTASTRVGIKVVALMTSQWRSGWWP